MKPDLYIDIGNSSIKTRWFTNGQWSVVDRWSPEQMDVLSRKAGDAGKVVISAVSLKNYDLLASTLKTDSLLLDHHALADYIHYNTPETLGMDRVLATVGAWSLTGSPALVVDAGTAITIDQVSSKGVFLGGVIMPGIAVLERSLRQNTDLPAVDRRLPDHWPPKSTEEALQWGLTGSVKAAVQAHIQKFRESDSDASIFMTGGDGQWLADITGLNVRVEPDLVFIGMKYVADMMNNSD